MKKFAVAIVSVAILLIAIMLVRTAGLPDRQIRDQPVSIALDEAGAARRLAGAVQFRTISNLDPARIDAREFRALHAYLESTFPAAHRALEREVVGELSLLYRWKGRNPARKPFIFMSHLDVVPVEPGTEHTWQHPPFSGDIAEGCIWGRGTLDVKHSATGLLEAAETLLASGFIPEQDIYFAFGHDEEVLGRHGAARIADLLHARGVRAEFVLDEGSCITENLVPGMKKPVALISTSEKGYLTVRLTATSPGGHSSMPPPRTAVGTLARALVKLETHPFATTMTPLTREMMTYLAPEMPWANRMVMANLWLTRGIVAPLMARSPSAAAALHTTIAPTMLSASPQENVLATHASALVNFRLLPGDSIEGVITRVQSLVKSEGIQVEALPGAWEAPPVSPSDGPAFRALQRTLAQIFPGVITAPFQMLGGTDARHYARLSPCVYRFMPIRVSPESINLPHGTNERLPVKDYANSVRFYIQLIRNAQRTGAENLP